MSSVEDTLKNLKSFFREQIEAHGPTAKGVDWKSEEAQFVRFEQLLKIHADPAQPFSLLDYGSGYGALLDYLLRRGLKVTYTGFDMNEAAVVEGQRLFGDKGDFHFTTDEASLQPADYVIASGVFNMRLNTPLPEWEAYVLATIDKLWSLCRRGLAFNSLTSYSDADKMRSDLYYANPCFLFDYCKTRLSRQVALLHDYGIYDFTILVRREG